MGTIGWIAVVGVVILGVYLLTRKSAIDVLADELQADNPQLSRAEAEAQAARAIAEAAVDTAQQVEDAAGVEAQAEAARAAEEAAAAAQAEAIRRAEEEEARRAAEEAAAQAERERAALAERWRNALAIAEDELVTARDAADRAMAAYNSQLQTVNLKVGAVVYGDIDYKISTAHYLGLGEYPTMPFSDLSGKKVNNDAISSVQIPRAGWRVTLYSDAYFGGNSLVLTRDCPDLRKVELKHGSWTWYGGALTMLQEKSWNDATSSIRVENTDARITLNSIKTDTLAACTAARLVAERVLTITADVRLLNLWIATANRLDGIANATIEKVASIEARLTQEA
jgi:hypothetical protein